VTPVADELIEERMASLVAAVPLRPPLSARASSVLQALTATPRRASFATLWCVAVVVGGVCAVPTRRSVTTSLGPARARCGLDVFVYGYQDHHVADICRHAEGVRLALFVMALVVVAAGLGTAAAVAHLGAAVRAAPAAAGLLVAGTAGLLTGVAALRPVTVVLGTTVASCGADSYFGTYPDAAVQRACRHADRGQAHVLEVAVVVAVLGLAGGAVLLWRRSPAMRRRLLLGAVAVIVLLTGLAVLRPVTVEVRPGMLASCGLDTWLAGYPAEAVQAGCRSHLGVRAAGLGAVVVLGLVAAVWALMVTRAPRPADRP
jgi:hypothetical protein